MNTYFTSDLHFYHKNIIDFCKRPYSSVGEMNEALILNWNETVEPTDVVYVLGDFSFGSPVQTEYVLSCLNGHKHLILGNHDRKGRAQKTKWELFFNSVNEYKRIKLNHMKFVLCHFPFRSWERGYVNLHGHTHGTMMGYKGQLDVGVDCHEYKPIEASVAYSLAHKNQNYSPYQ